MDKKTILHPENNPDIDLLPETTIDQVRGLKEEIDNKATINDINYLESKIDSKLGINSEVTTYDKAYVKNKLGNQVLLDVVSNVTSQNPNVIVKTDQYGNILTSYRGSLETYHGLAVPPTRAILEKITSECDKRKIYKHSLKINLIGENLSARFDWVFYASNTNNLTTRDLYDYLGSNTYMSGVLYYELTYYPAVLIMVNEIDYIIKYSNLAITLTNVVISLNESIEEV